MQLSDPDVVTFDADRPDFNGALAQFAIGLLQTTTPVDSPMAWRALFNNPPDATTLADWFMPCAAAFEFDGPGARFMQDFDLREGDADPVGIAGLLIESPGEKTLTLNKDHFIKRGQVTYLCAKCAAQALFTLQINAPTGGAGHRTGLRGGGPLTTLLLAQARPDTSLSLWHDLWLNVQHGLLEGNGGDETKVAPHFIFPWLASISAIQEKDGETAPIQVHPAHVYWAMPRRIRLDFDSTTAGTCDLCAQPSEQLVHRYLTRNYGLNYKGPWKHPLSPHYESKGDWLPLHPQPGGIGYRHWLGWVLGMQNDKRNLEAAQVISGFLSAKVEPKVGIELRLWTFGFDMDNMKARCWYEATLPLYALNDCPTEARVALREDVGDWLAAAELASKELRDAIKNAWFGREARGDLSFIDTSFWGRTEHAFYELLRERIAAARDGLSWDRPAIAKRWLSLLQRTAIDLFDHQYAGTGPVGHQRPDRVAQAYRALCRALNGPRILSTLGLAPKKKTNPSRKAAAAAA